MLSDEQMCDDGDWQWLLILVEAVSAPFITWNTSMCDFPEQNNCWKGLDDLGFLSVVTKCVQRSLWSLECKLHCWIHGQHYSCLYMHECVPVWYSIHCTLAFHYKEKLVCHLLPTICLCTLRLATSPSMQVCPYTRLTFKESWVTFCPNISTFPTAVLFTGLKPIKTWCVWI